MEIFWSATHNSLQLHKTANFFKYVWWIVKKISDKHDYKHQPYFLLSTRTLQKERKMSNCAKCHKIIVAISEFIILVYTHEKPINANIDTIQILI